MRRIIHLSFFRGPALSLSFFSRNPGPGIVPSGLRYRGSLSTAPNRDEEVLVAGAKRDDPFSSALVKKLLCCTPDEFSCFLPNPSEKLEVEAPCSATLLGVNPGPDSSPTFIVIGLSTGFWKLD